MLADKDASQYKCSWCTICNKPLEDKHLRGKDPCNCKLEEGELCHYRSLHCSTDISAEDAIHAAELDELQFENYRIDMATPRKDETPTEPKHYGPQKRQAPHGSSGSAKLRRQGRTAGIALGSTNPYKEKMHQRAKKLRQACSQGKPMEAIDLFKSGCANSFARYRQWKWQQSHPGLEVLDSQANEYMEKGAIYADAIAEGNRALRFQLEREDEDE